jgi:hypothetical protein
VFRFGFSFKNIKAKIIPKMGCVLLMILAVLTEKCLKLLTNIVCPIAVVNKPRAIICGNCVEMFDVSIKKMAGNNTTVSTASW